MRVKEGGAGPPSPWAATAGGFAAAGALLLVWEGAVRVFAVPAWMLPAPSRIRLRPYLARWELILSNALVTATETLLGLAVRRHGRVSFAALLDRRLAARPASRSGRCCRWPQAIPVFAHRAAPFVTWLGFGLAPKIVMAALIIFFPVGQRPSTTACGGPTRTSSISRGSYGAGPLRTLLTIRAPAALPALGSGLRVAAGIAPIGAVRRRMGRQRRGPRAPHAACQRAGADGSRLRLPSWCWRCSRWRSGGLVDIGVSRVLHWAPETLSSRWETPPGPTNPPTDKVRSR